VRQLRRLRCRLAQTLEVAESQRHGAAPGSASGGVDDTDEPPSSRSKSSIADANRRSPTRCGTATRSTSVAVPQGVAIVGAPFAETLRTPAPFTRPGVDPAALEPAAFEPAAFEPADFNPGVVEPGVVKPSAAGPLPAATTSSFADVLVILDMSRRYAEMCDRWETPLSRNCEMSHLDVLVHAVGIKLYRCSASRSPFGCSQAWPSCSRRRRLLRASRRHERLQHPASSSA
jgi:hypothetical protein